MLGSRKTLLTLAVAMTLTACGSGGGGNGGGGAGTPAPGPDATVTGKAVDGYLSNATVLCDANGNSQADPGEAVVLTNGQGDFTFSPACASTIVVTGGTSIDTGLPFKGMLKAPAGSTVATPLTNLVVSSGLTPAQIAAALGLPAGTDVTKIDPAATNGAGLANADLMKKTLAVQQIVQQSANVLAALAENTSASAVEAIYAEVAKAVGAALAANPATPLIGAGGTVNTAVVSDIVQRAVERVAATQDSALATAKAKIADFDKTSVAELTAAAIAEQADRLAKSSGNDASLTKSMQSDTTVANAADQIGILLTKGNASSVDLSAAGASLKNLSIANATGDTAGETAAQIALQADVAAQPNGTTITLTNLDKPTNYLGIAGDTIYLGGTAYSLDAFRSGGITLARPTIGFSPTVNGTAIPVNASGMSTIPVRIGAELSNTNGSGQLLQIIIDQVNLTASGNVVSASIPSTATLYAYGKTASGATGNIRVTNLPSQVIANDSSGLITLDFNEVLTQILTQTPSQNSVFSGLQNVSGKFNMKLVISNVEIRKADTNATLYPILPVVVTGSNQSPVSGAGVEGTVTIQ